MHEIACTKTVILLKYKQFSKKGNTIVLKKLNLNNKKLIRI